MYHSFLIHSSADGHLGCFHVLAFINRGAHVSFRSGFLGVHAQKWDCWVIGQFYFQLPLILKVSFFGRSRLALQLNAETHFFDFLL